MPRAKRPPSPLLYRDATLWTPGAYLMYRNLTKSISSSWPVFFRRTMSCVFSCRNTEANAHTSSSSSTQISSPRGIVSARMRSMELDWDFSPGRVLFGGMVAGILSYHNKVRRTSSTGRFYPWPVTCQV